MSLSSKYKNKNNNLKSDSGRFATKRSVELFNGGSVARVTDSVLLYRLVFKGRKAALLAILLCLCFATQAINFAEASEDSETVALETVVLPEQAPPVAEEQPATNGETPTESVAESTVTEPVPAAEVPADEADNSPATSSSSAEAGQAVSDVTASSSAGEAAPVSGSAQQVTDERSSTSTSSSTDQDTATTEDSAQSTDTGTSTVSADLTESPQATSTDAEATQEAVSAETDQLVFTVESDTHFSFNKNQCTRIEDGTFYCQELAANIGLEDSLLAAPDADGDLEIYLVRDGQRYQITNNQVDDAAPYYDELSNSIVWHRLLDDRYQIIVYDIESGTEEQITHTEVNNMQPARAGDYIVWQRWVQDNWEVILYDGQNETQITNSSRHDIAPHIRGPLVIWNSQSNDGSQELKTYDIKSRTQTTITDSTGVSVSNPRMVVIYEALYQNGDIVTKGFDLVSGQIVPLAALPRQLPSDLPDAEPTEEVRALIQNKPEPKEAAVPQVAPTDGDGNKMATTSASTTEQSGVETDEQTLDLRTLSTPELIKHLTEKDIATSTIPDLVLENQESVTAEAEVAPAKAAIPDLVISSSTPLNNSSSSTHNSQE